jgi:hypothetical protein
MRNNHCHCFVKETRPRNAQNWLADSPALKELFLVDRVTEPNWGKRSKRGARHVANSRLHDSPSCEHGLGDPESTTAKTAIVPDASAEV